MQKERNNRVETKKALAEMVRRDEVTSRMKFAAAAETEELFGKLGTTQEGLREALVEDSRERYGDNKVTHGKKVSLMGRIAKSFVNPFTAILFGLAAVLAFTDIILAEPGEADPMTVIIIMTMVLISGVLRFVQETRSGNAAENLLQMIDLILLGSDLDKMTDDALGKTAEKVSVFAKLSPQQKARVITALRNNGHSVGYMGDGINDAAAMKASDVGISVDTAVDIAKESADVILLEKDLMVLEKGIIEGRKIYANMIKYIKMTASSNFGNMFSVLAASAFLPFIPMMPIHLILLNLIYDLSCTAIPWDNVDKEFLAVPRKWDASSVSKFMVWIGPTSSVFDIATYLLMYFIICPAMCGGQLFHQITDPAMQAYFIAVFHAGWFVESMWSQTLVIHMIRTPKIPFIQSRASLPVTLLTFTGIAVLTMIPFTGFGASIGLAALPLMYFPWLALIIVLYMVLVTVFKKIYIRRCGELL